MCKADAAVLHQHSCMWLNLRWASQAKRGLSIWPKESMEGQGSFCVKYMLGTMLLTHGKGVGGGVGGWRDWRVAGGAVGGEALLEEYGWAQTNRTAHIYAVEQRCDITGRTSTCWAG